MTIKYALGQTDMYKLFHNQAYHPDITKVYSNYTSRNGSLSNIPNSTGEVVFVGLQYFIIDVLIDEWNETFFNVEKSLAVGQLKRIADKCLGVDYDVSHFESLHDLGYLPIEIKALPEGSSMPYGVPCATFINTVDGFQWLTNYLETVFSTENWPIQTSATTAKAYLTNVINSFNECGISHELVPFMCHDFSMRGCFGRHAAAMSGFGHLCSFAGTDTIPAIMFAEKYYNADVDTELVGASVPATEHSTVTSYIQILEEQGIPKLDAEVDYVRRLMKQVPTGILSHVSDSYDFWNFIAVGLSDLREDIMARDGKLVIRPDSGDPVQILCGCDPDSDALHTCSNVWECRGLIQCLWTQFGGTVNDKGYKILDSHIGAIYGDSITLQRQEEIIARLMKKGFAPIVVLGIGSYSYQMVSRDTHGSAVKATWVEYKGAGVDVYKDPATDRKKKSLKGLLRVHTSKDGYYVKDEQSVNQEMMGDLTTVFKDGKLLYETSLKEIRARILSTI